MSSTETLHNNARASHIPRGPPPTERLRLPYDVFVLGTLCALFCALSTTFPVPVPFCGVVEPAVGAATTDVVKASCSSRKTTATLGPGTEIVQLDDEPPHPDTTVLATSPMRTPPPLTTCPAQVMFAFAVRLDAVRSLTVTFPSGMDNGMPPTVVFTDSWNKAVPDSAKLKRTKRLGGMCETEELPCG